MYRVLFLGTPQFSVPFLEALIKSDDFEVIGVITEPDRPAGRRKRLKKTAISEYVYKLQDTGNNNQKNINKQIPIFKPETILNLKSKILNLNPVIAVVVAYGQIIPKEILDIPKHGFINVHPSDLPKYRGPSPIQSVLLNGDKKTVISVMKMDDKMDHGPILDKKEINIDINDNYFSLEKKILNAGPNFLIKTLNKYLNKKIKPRAQNHTKATYCKLIKKNDSEIDWSKSASEIHNQIRAYIAWPKAYTIINNKRWICLKSKVKSRKLKLILVQLEGKKPTSWKEFLNGYKEKLPKQLTDKVY